MGARTRFDLEGATLKMSAFNLQDHGITVDDVRRNLPPSKLYEEAIRHEADARIADQRRAGGLFRGEDRPVSER